MNSDTILLHALARACGIATSYLDFDGRQVKAPTETLEKVLKSMLGIPLDDLGETYKKLRQEHIDRALPSVIVAWNGHLPAHWIWMEKPENVVVLLQGEIDDAGTEKIIPLEDCRIITRKTNGRNYVRMRLPEWHGIPYGYYFLVINPGTADEKQTFVISAPEKLQHEEKSWGAFVPAYALNTGSEQGLGGYRELRQAAAYILAHGGQFIGTLPLLPVYYDGVNTDPSPYAPVSRLFLNEIFLDLDDLPGVPHKATGQKFDMDQIDYSKTYLTKKDILKRTARAFFQANPDGDRGYLEFSQDSPWLHDYADFRANNEPDDYDDIYKLHLYAQYACHVQLNNLQKGRTAALYLDYPVGLHRAGYDSAAFSHLFMKDISVGAPPDLLYSDGQNWGFNPLHPRAMEHDRFRYFRATLHHYFKYARMLRLDHVMGFYRLYCIPDGEKSDRGTYIHYPLEAFMAILCLEAWRHNGILIGENLGTVPAAINQAMRRHGIHRMWISQFEIKSDPGQSFTSIEKDMIASMNTHDLFPFAAFMKGDDLKTLQQAKLLKPDLAKNMADDRHKLLKEWEKQEDPLMQTIKGMASSPARFIMISPEDFWAEEKPHNIPGTRQGNWVRKLSVPLNQWDYCSKLQEAFYVLNRYRGQR